MTKKEIKLNERQYKEELEYIQNGFDGYIRVDHVPTMAGEENELPGYETLGRLYAIGYLKGLLEMAKGVKE